MEPMPTRWVWSRPGDEAIYRDAVRRFRAEDGVSEGDLSRRPLAEPADGGPLPAAEFQSRAVVERVLAAGFREYDDYQDAVEQLDLAAEGYERTRSPGTRLLLRVWLVTLRLQVAFMRRQWRESLPAALSSVIGRPVLDARPPCHRPGDPHRSCGATASPHT